MPVQIAGGEDPWGERGHGGVPQMGKDGEVWQTVRPRRREALRQEEHGQGGQQERRRSGFPFGMRRSRSLVHQGLRFTDDNRVASRVSNGFCGAGASNSCGRSVSREGKKLDGALDVLKRNPREGVEGSRKDVVGDSSVKRFVTFYFSNFPRNCQSSF